MADEKKGLVRSVKEMAAGPLLAGAEKVKSYDPNDAFIIAADPRGGSTWLFELLKKHPAVATLFEPLWLARVPEAIEAGFGYEQYIPEGADWPEAKAFFERVFSGGLLNKSLCAYSSSLDYFNAERLLVKFVRAKQLLPWLLEQFDFKFQPIVMTRHPVAVAVSMQRHGAWDEFKGAYRLPDDQRFGDYIEPHRAFLEGVKTVEERLIAQWCVANSYILHHPDNNKNWITLHYEHLNLAPEETLKHVYNIWGLDLPDGILADVNEASKTTIGGDFTADKKQQLTKWRQRINYADLKRYLEIFDHFEIELYGEDAMPNLNAKGIGHIPSVVAAGG